RIQADRRDHDADRPRAEKKKTENYGQSQKQKPQAARYKLSSQEVLTNLPSAATKRTSHPERDAQSEKKNGEPL
ncbi:hypothetical protein, partial [Salmonella sp. s29873]|uniref:hypothetical protein n=1 Tax=Salmonella sp. s29873 TaxID=3159634 RepID=UPI0039810B87